MSLTETLVKYLDRKFATLERRHVRAIENQNAILEKLYKFLCHGPDWEEQEFGSAEEDRIEDSVGEYDTEGQAKAQIKEDWREAGYPDDLTQLIR